jgi:2-polyprenyl-3-methyl-5-hydroxy-6-metoxy-1,4-benzoquinol methylase
MKKEYFNNRNQSIDSNDKDKTQRKIFAEREIKTLSILQDIVNENFYTNSNFILDLGCGDQYLNLQIAKDKKSYLGLDIDDLNFENDTFPLDDNSFDLILSYSVIEHIHDPSIF